MTSACLKIHVAARPFHPAFRHALASLPPTGWGLPAFRPGTHFPGRAGGAESFGAASDRSGGGGGSRSRFCCLPAGAGVRCLCQDNRSRRGVTSWVRAPGAASPPGRAPPAAAGGEACACAWASGARAAVGASHLRLACEGQNGWSDQAA